MPAEKDGQVDHFDLCEECYDQLTATFKIPVETEEQTEYLQPFYKDRLNFPQHLIIKLQM